MNKEVYVLGIETSCDETSVAVVLNGRGVLSNVISSQIEVHKDYGGVVPEIASRKHIEKIEEVVDRSLKKSGLELKDIDCIAVTYAPGLEGALLVGLMYGKTLSYMNDIPLVGVHHIAGHICANYIDTELEPPFVTLVVSGGHTLLVLVKDYDEFEVLGSTRDDACGEAYDKIARVLGLEYPGGPRVDALSKVGNKEAMEFKRVMLEKDSLDFSFSGLKSNVLNYINKCKMKEEEIKVEDVCASFQEAVVDVLVKKSKLALDKSGVKKLALAGGVSSNSRLRERIKEMCKEEEVDLYIPKSVYCTDNGAMIGVSGYYKHLLGKNDNIKLNVKNNRKL